MDQSTRPVLPLTSQPMTSSSSLFKSQLNTSNLPIDVATVAIKAPSFTERAPVAWFKILEAQFHLANITKSDTKFYHALASLPADLVSQLSIDVLNQADYHDLKTAVCEHHEISKPELMDRFLAATPMTGRPSHFLGEIRRLASQIGANDDLIRHKFLQVLPPLIAPILTTQRSSSLDDLGKLADELVALNPFHDRVSSITPHSRQCHEQPTSSTKSNNSPRNSCYNLRPFGHNQRPKVCRWHVYYGCEAKIVGHGANGQTNNVAE
jgi:hypothetical protein